jgi:hypothetical protein
MDFKERILTAMNHEEPDRVPVMGLIMDPATVNLILNKDPVDFPGLLRKPVLRPAIKSLMNTNWFWNRMYYGNFSGALESALELGFDANWTIYALMQLNGDGQSDLGLVWHDVFGRVWEMGSDDRGNMAVNYSRPLCPTEEEWEAWVERKASLFDKVIENATAFHMKLVAEYGDRIMPVGYAAPGIFENSWQPIGFVNFTRFMYQKPQFVKRVIDFQTDFYLRYLDGVMKSGVEVVLGGDDLGQKTGPMMRPEQIEKLYGESYRRVADAVHSQNKKLIFHSCGNVYQLLDKFIEWGFDGIITMEPTAGMDLGKVREMVGHRLVLVGNLDVSYLVVKGTQQEVEEAVKKAIRDAASGGGYILSTCHSQPHVDPTRLKWMVDAARKYGTYPIAI